MSATAEWIYSRQEVPEYLDVYGVSDWAGDEERKRSTTGVAKIFGGHQVDAASATQPLVALSSAQAEFCAGPRVDCKLACSTELRRLVVS